MIYFIGIKGTGMAALATMLYDIGETVCGSDLQKHFFTEDELVKRGIKIFPFNPDNIKDGYTVIIGNAFQEDFPEVSRARRMPHCQCYRYHEYLGKLMENYRTIGVCGSHGKTTTTAMLAAMLTKFKKTGYLIGDGEGYLAADTEYLCVESCEFRRHFLAYHPDYALITNIEIDHVDYFKDEADYFNAYQEFVANVKEAVFYCGDDAECRRLKIDIPHFSYGLNEDNDFVARDVESDGERTSFALYFQDNYLYNFNLPFVGEHILRDALAVIAYGITMCFAPQMIEFALNQYHSPKRRYVVEEYHDTILIDDYAHHPTEVKLTLQATRKRYPQKKIIAIFKPHRASRVKYFANAFKEALQCADEIYLIDFTSIDDKQDGVDIDINYLKDLIPGSHILSEDEKGAKQLAAHRGEVLVFMSSKDIYNIAEMTKALI